MVFSKYWDEKIRNEINLNKRLINILKEYLIQIKYLNNKYYITKNYNFICS